MNASAYDSDPQCAAIKSRLKCWEAAERLGLPEGKRRHGWRHFQCVAHDDSNPSMGCEDQVWTCLSCGASGNVFSLIQRANGCDFPTAKRTAAEWAGVDLGERSRITRAESAANKAKWAKENQARTQRQLAAANTEREVRSRVMAKIWEVTERADTYSPAVSRMLTGRAIDPGIAHDLGCRDWFTVGPELREALANFSADELSAAGLRGLNRDREPYDWQPLRAAYTAKDQRRAGLAVPIWQPGVPHPMAYRWRYVTPWPRKNQKKPLKCATQPSGHLTYKVPQILGVSLPPMVDDFPPTHYANGEPIPDGVRPRRSERDWFDSPPAERWIANPIPTPSTAPIVFVTEGEPDWFSVAECVRGRGAAVVGIATSGSKDAETLKRLLRDARFVWVLGHRPKDAPANSEPPVLADTVSKCAPLGVPIGGCTLNELNDANDHHQRGELAALIERYLEASR